jgi:hypothetical protein
MPPKTRLIDRQEQWQTALADPELGKPEQETARRYRITQRHRHVGDY